ncbi:AEC family transporter [Paenibacillus sp. NEAU-GSW1]|uniref:AEC family transporter n=1 Tax=Paenibacillus sp. NEAU-GSW1 TaxID=2682486 RepID=UPI0012E0DAFE|nr:AEC family transporter [Paenibacillus sp. NEAU-GSW1]MUT65260.1 AEC family transporter [Paenibacillus sp. NEAU-GSW1]
MIYTFYHIIIPILIPIGIGALLHRKFKFDLGSFSKLILYYYVPALAFVKVLEAQLSAKLVVMIFGFLIVQFIAMALIGKAISRVMGYSKPLAASFANSVTLTNNGNIGIPVNALAFKHDAFAMSIQMMVVVFELFATFTFGLINASKAAAGLKKSLLQFAKMPVLYAIIAGTALHMLRLPMPEPVMVPLEQIADGMLPFALVSIGAQIASAAIHRNTAAVLLSSLTRLVLSPVCAYLLLMLLGIEGIAAQALFIASAIPTSRNSAALALEYGNEPGFAAQAVLLSTLLSSVTMTVVIDLSNHLF